MTADQPPEPMREWLAAKGSAAGPSRAVERAAVKAVVTELTQRAPGHSVELRVPPFAAVQLIEGPRHRRGTPSAVVEMDAATLLDLATGAIGWQEALTAGRTHASGERSDLAGLFPLWPIP